jgi:Bacterial protein of unknown function (DUF899)
LLPATRIQFETYGTTIRGVEAMGYRLLDLTGYGRQETWEDSSTGWPQRLEGKQTFPTNGRPSSGDCNIPDRLQVMG